MTAHKKTSRQADRDALAELGSYPWRQAFYDAQVPLWISDVTATIAAIAEVKNGGVADFGAWLDVHPEFILKAIGLLRLVDVNDAVVRQLKAESSTEALSALPRIVVPESLPAFKVILTILAGGGGYYEGESQYLNLVGETFFTMNRAKLPSATDNPAILVMSTADITDLKLTQQRLADSRKRYRSLVETAQDVILCHDLAGTITFVNQAGLDLSGWSREEVLGRPIADLAPERLRPEVLKRRQRRIRGDDRPELFETAFINARGEEVAIEASSTLIPGPSESGSEPNVLILARDISERKRAEQERLELEAKLRDAQKLESLGVLARGIAHDFNNLLVAIMGNAELLRGDAGGDIAQIESVEAIMEAANRAADLCRQMQAYVGNERFDLQVVDLNQVVAEIEQLMHITLTGSAALDLDLCKPTLPPILVDAAQIRQVVMNLVANAAEALNDGGGRVTLSTGCRDYTADELAEVLSTTQLRPGSYVFCTVRDDGAGMDHLVRSRLFEPFFTTRFVGRGLGLSASLSIVQGHGGGFLVDSEPGRGSAVTFLLPVHSVQDAGRAKSRKSKKAPDPIYQVLYGKTIMVVDEDAPVRTIIEGALRRLGCRVLSAKDGHGAVGIFSERCDEIDAIVLDLAAGGLEGAATFTRLQTIDPKVPIVVTSGLDNTTILARVAELDAAGFLPKPFQIGQVGQVLGRVLE